MHDCEMHAVIQHTGFDKCTQNAGSSVDLSDTCLKQLSPKKDEWRLG